MTTPHRRSTGINLQLCFVCLMDLDDLDDTTCAGHYSLGNVREVMKRAAKNCSLNYVDKMLRTTANVKNTWTGFDRSLIRLLS